MSFAIETAMPFVQGTLYARLREDAGAEWNAYVRHPFVAQIGQGTLPRDEYLAWVVQDYLYLVSYARAYALLIYKSDTIARMQDAAAIVSSLLNTEMSLHRQQLREAGIDAAMLEHAAETLETIAYGRYVLDRGQCGDALDLVVTLSACLAGYAEIGLRLIDDAPCLAANPYREWIETYAGPDYLGLVEKGLANLEGLWDQFGGPARYPSLLAQFRQAVRLEASFWNAGRSALTGRK